MSTAQPTPERCSPAISYPPVSFPPFQPLKQQRVLACILCHQRKVKCDRKFPCSNCIKSQTECVPATAVRRRPRRQFAEHDLLERIRKYEELLQRNNIRFEPLRKDLAAEKPSPNTDGGYGSEDDQQVESTRRESLSPSTNTRSEGSLQYEGKNYWQVVHRRFRDPSTYYDCEIDFSRDEVREAMAKSAWDRSSGNNTFLILGSRKTATPLSTLHPEPVQIFRFWQVYLDNVNPMLKVIHAPSMQARIVEAISDLESISPTLEALMFSIYCMSVTSLSVEDCQAMFNSSKGDLLTKYQSGCQQALLNSGFLRTSDRDCLTALYLYTISAGTGTDPRSLSTLLGIAFRIAQRLGIHSEAVSTRNSPFEAEMRRRLWWSLMLFDFRIGEMASCKNTSLNPTWDCKIPLNVNDSDLRPEMKETPSVQGFPTDAIFAVVRGELGEFLRYADFHLDFTNPSLKLVAHHEAIPRLGDMVALERMIEEKYLKFCDPEIQLHFMTIWMTRGYIAKCQLMECYSKISNSPPPQAEELEVQIDTTISYAFRMLECDTKIMKSPLTKGYHWLAGFYFPFPAYIHVAQELRRCPDSKHAEKGWKLMSDNFEGRLAILSSRRSPLFDVFSQAIIPAWEGCAASIRASGGIVTTPKIVLSIRQALAEIAQISHNDQTVDATEQESSNITSLSGIDMSMSTPVNFVNNTLFGMDMGGQSSYAEPGSDGYPSTYGQAPFDVDANQANWLAMTWGYSG